jgi:glycosyltransferase involved in cell wall biosynthesis
LSEPTFSIVITSFNQRAFIDDAVRSALLFREAVREIVVVDDASTDGSQNALAEYGDAIELVALPTNHGKGGARNVGASRATGDYLIFLDGDDAFLPWTLRVYARVAEARRPTLILCPMLWFRDRIPAPPNEAPRAIEFVEYADYMSKDRSFGLSASSVVIEREAFHAVHGWSGLPVMQDQDIVFRLCDVGPVAHVLAPPTTLHRAHPAQSINRVPPFLDVLYQMLRSERAGNYPGGAGRRFDRFALFGGLVLHWTRRAFKAGLYVESARLLLRGRSMAVAAIAQRGRMKLRGRQPPQTLDM